MKKHLDFADYFSFLNVLFGFLAIWLRDPRYIFMSMIMDGLDGYFARKGYSGKYGKFVDSLADFASFGMATSIFFPMLSLPYLLAGMYRLARFTAEEQRNFIGFPISSASLISISLLILFGEKIAGFSSIILAFLMISKIEYPKIKNPYILGFASIFIIASFFNSNFVYAVLILNALYLTTPLLSGRLGKYF